MTQVARTFLCLMQKMLLQVFLREISMKFLLAGLIALFSISTFAGFVPKKVEGTVVDMFIGELSPYAGDYCVVVVKDFTTNRLYGLVSDEGPQGPVCDDIDAGNVQDGWPVGAYQHDLALIKNIYLLGALRDYDSKVFYLYFNSNFTNLDNQY
jgi:hypothetical protein